MNAITSILLHVDLSPRSAVRLQAALDIAARYGAVVTAIFAGSTVLPEVPYSYAAGAAAAALAAEQHLEARERAKAALQLHLRSDGPPVIWADLVGDAVVAGFIQESAYADLLVLGQAEASAGERIGEAPGGFVENVVIDSGKPALIVPAQGAPHSIGRRVLVAWNGSAQAAHAVTAALPFMRQADLVHVIGWSAEPLAGRCSRVDIGTFLARHGITAEVERRDVAPKIGAQIAMAAAEIDADLVVLGCYGHSRARERMLGGVTRSALTTLPVTMLLAH